MQAGEAAVGGRGFAMRERLRRVGLGLLALIVLWVLLALSWPRLPWEAESRVSSFALAGLVQHQRLVAAGDESFGDVSGSVLLQHLAAQSETPVCVVVRRDAGGVVDGVCVYPRDEREYRYGPIARVVWLDFAYHEPKSWLLTRAGALYFASRFHAAHPPTPADLALCGQDVPESPWRLERQLTPTSGPVQAPTERRHDGGGW